MPTTPQDHKSKASTEPKSPEGWDLLKPFDEVESWDQVHMLAIMHRMIKGDIANINTANVDIKDLDLDAAADLLEFLVTLAPNPDEYKAWARKNVNKALELGSAYADQLGESKRSESS